MATSSSTLTLAQSFRNRRPRLIAMAGITLSGAAVALATVVALNLAASPAAPLSLDNASFPHEQLSQHTLRENGIAAAAPGAPSDPSTMLFQHTMRENGIAAAAPVAPSDPSTMLFQHTLRENGLGRGSTEPYRDYGQRYRGGDR
jgi:hypothetical protein